MSRRHGSVGLGLYIAYEIDTGHGGTIDFTSTVEYGTSIRTRQTTSRCTLPTDSGLLSKVKFFSVQFVRKSVFARIHIIDVFRA